MKNTHKLIVIAVITLVFASCGAKKGGCGLTSDANKMEQTTTSKVIISPEV